MLRVLGLIGSFLVITGALLLPSPVAKADTGTTSPPATYQGTILVDGKAPATGGTIVAEKWNGYVCGKGTVYSNGASAFFIMTVHSADSSPGCFAGGDPIIFKFKGMKAQEIPVFYNWGEQTVHLTFKSTRYFQCTPQLCPLLASPVLVLPPSR